MNIEKEKIHLLLGIGGTINEQAEAYREFFNKYPEKGKDLIDTLIALPEDDLSPDCLDGDDNATHLSFMKEENQNSSKVLPVDYADIPSSNDGDHRDSLVKKTSNRINLMENKFFIDLKENFTNAISGEIEYTKAVEINKEKGFIILHGYLGAKTISFKTNQGSVYRLYRVFFAPQKARNKFLELEKKYGTD